MFAKIRRRVAGWLDPETRAGLTSEQAKRIFSTGIISNAGVDVSESSALTYGPIWSAIDVISGDCASTPLITYRRLDRGKERARDHTVYRLLKRSPGNGQTANLFISRLVAQALLYGQSFARIVRNGPDVERLELLNSVDVKPYRTAGRGVAYDWHYPDSREPQEPLPASDMLHIAGLTFTSLGGVSLIRHARNTIGRYLAAEAFGDDFFKNASLPTGFFISDVPLTGEAKDRFVDEIEKVFNGKTGRRLGVGVLEQGMTWEATGINAADAMLVEMLQLGPRDVARFFKLPPHKLGIEGTNSYASVEQENLNYYRTCLMHWFTRIESEINEKLFSEDEKRETAGGMFSEFLVENVLRPDSLTRHHIYQIGRSAGYYSANDVREMDNRNPVEDGDVYANPYTSSGVVEMEPDPTGQDNRLTAVDYVVTDAVTRAAKRLQRSKKDDMRAAHEPRLREMLEPAATLAGGDVGRWVDTLFDYAGRGEHMGAVAAITGGDDGKN